MLSCHFFHACIKRFNFKLQIFMMMLLIFIRCNSSYFTKWKHYLSADLNSIRIYFRTILQSASGL